MHLKKELCITLLDISDKKKQVYCLINLRVRSIMLL
jgi:hypothetical protein